MSTADGGQVKTEITAWQALGVVFVLAWGLILSLAGAILLIRWALMVVL
jgi:hypothetical protein